MKLDMEIREGFKKRPKFGTSIKLVSPHVVGFFYPLTLLTFISNRLRTFCLNPNRLQICGLKKYSFKSYDTLGLRNIVVKHQIAVTFEPFGRFSKSKVLNWCKFDFQFI